MAKTRQARLPVIRRPISAYKLLDKILDVVRKEPRRLRMSGWGATAAHDPTGEYPDNKQMQPACGTVGCLAGWAVTLMRDPKKANVNDRESWGGAAVGAALLLGFNGPNEVGGLFSGVTKTKDGTAAHVKEVALRVRKFQEDHKKRLKATIIRPGASRW